MLLFEKSFHPETDFEIIAQAAFDNGLIESDEYVTKVADTAMNALSEIDGVIDENLRGWSKTRISKVSLAVLRLALCEMLYIDDVPTGVSINEAVELCKSYSTAEDASFVNGVLGTIARRLEAEKSAQGGEQKPENGE